jgi:hypothetical protein
MQAGAISRAIETGRGQVLLRRDSGRLGGAPG